MKTELLEKALTVLGGEKLGEDVLWFTYKGAGHLNRAILRTKTAAGAGHASKRAVAILEAREAVLALRTHVLDILTELRIADDKLEKAEKEKEA